MSKKIVDGWLLVLQFSNIAIKPSEIEKEAQFFRRNGSKKGMNIIGKAGRANEKSPTIGLFAAELEQVCVDCRWDVSYCTNRRELEVRIMDTKGAADDNPKWFGEGNVVGKVVPYLREASKFPRPLDFRCQRFEMSVSN